MTPEFWRGRRVLLTGHTGFKGAWIALWLDRLGARVTGLSLPPEGQPNLFELIAPDLSSDSVLLDLRDEAAVHDAVAQADPEVVFHLAAQAIVRRSYRQPVETLSTNVMGTAHLLDALRLCKNLRAALVVTSDKAYANRDTDTAFVETDALGGDDPYSASKAAAEIVTEAYVHSFFAPTGVAVATARAGNVIGGGDWAEDRLVPDIWRAVESGTPLKLRYPDATRPWQHVLEPVSGYLLYVERLAQATPGDLPSALNFGPPPTDRLTVAQVAEQILSALGSAQPWQQATGSQPAEKQVLALDAGLADQVLDWRPRLSPTDGLAWTADWYRAFSAGGDARRLTQDQIERYAAL